jgi:hypothetical protein
MGWIKRIARQYFGWIIACLFIGLAIIAFIFAETWYITRINNIATTLLAILTAAYVAFTYYILKSTQAQPNVIAFLYDVGGPNDIEIYLSIKNIGTRPAYEVEVTFYPPLEILAPTEFIKGASGPMLKQPYMPPGLDVRNLVSTTLNVLHMKDESKKFKVKIRYRDFKYKWYDDTFEIDLGSFIFKEKFIIYDTNSYLNKISKALEEINKSILSIHNRNKVT